MKNIRYASLSPDYFDAVIELGNQVHGDNYLDAVSLQSLYERSIVGANNASFVSLIGDKLVGFRLTVSANKWILDRWCTPEKWNVNPSKVCYFKCNTVDSAYRKLGIGSTLLSKSIEQAKMQGAMAGLAHIWLASPGNSAYRYFSKCGGRVINNHPGKWRDLSIHDGYCCPVCPDVCECEAAEMLLTFK